MAVGQFAASSVGSAWPISLRIGRRRRREIGLNMSISLERRRRWLRFAVAFAAGAPTALKSLARTRGGATRTRINAPPTRPTTRGRKMTSRFNHRIIPTIPKLSNICACPLFIPGHSASTFFFLGVLVFFLLDFVFTRKRRKTPTGESMICICKVEIVYHPSERP
jgi:hypothetical protein